MSHVCEVFLEIRDLDALEAACRKLGLKLHRGKQTYQWYGQSAGDYPVPEGFTADELGKCEHSIGLADTTGVTCGSYVDGKWVSNIPGSYEIGVVRRKDGKTGYVLHWDFWHGGFGMEQVVGANCQKLKQAYATERAKLTAKRQGFKVKEVVTANGGIRLELTK